MFTLHCINCLHGVVNDLPARSTPSSEATPADLEARLRRAESGLETSTSTSSSSDLSIESQTSPDKYTVLRVESLTAKSLKNYMIVRFFIQHSCQILWTIGFGLLWRPRTSAHQAALLTTSAVLASVLCCIIFVFLGKFLYAIFRAARAKQIWSRRRARLAVPQIIQMCCLALANVFLALSGGYGRERSYCHLYPHFCIWSNFWIWTGLIGVLMMQLVITHTACAWTDESGTSRRTLLMQWLVKPEKGQKHALILDASWLMHLPKLLFWLLMQATLVVQLVESLRGTPYRHVTCAAHGWDQVCSRTVTWRVANLTRVGLLGLYLIWMGVLTVRGVVDMQRLPYGIGRLGRVLMRLRCSSDLGLNHGGLLAIGLLLWGLRALPCFTCAQEWILLSTNLTATGMVVMSAFLFQPVKPAAGERIIMQVWLQYFAWTEKSHAKKMQKRNDFDGVNTAGLSEEPMFCFETAVKMLYWCSMAYEYQEDREPTLTEETAMQMYGLEQLHVLRDEATATKCLVAWGPASLVIAFRGTANMKNAVHDAKGWLVPSTEDVGPAKMWHSSPAVHSGFHKSWHTSLKQSLIDLITQECCSSKEEASKIRVRITGHSLGGVMAVIAALDIADLLPWQSIQVYTVGAPRPGNYAFANDYSSRLKDTWHIINERDPVPLIAKFGSLYARPGHRVLISPKGDMMVRPTPLDVKLNTYCKRVSRHYLLAYRKSLVEVIRTQLKQPKFEDGLQGVLELAQNIDLTSTLLAADLEHVKVAPPQEAAAATITSLLSPEEAAV